MNRASIDVTGFLPVFLRSKWQILLSGLLTAGLAFGVTRILPARYMSEGSLIIEHPATAGNDPKNPTVLNSIFTQADVIKSPGLIRSSVRDLGNPAGLVPTARLPASVMDFFGSVRAHVTAWLQPDEQSNADAEIDKLNYIRDHLKVETKENSSVLSVQFEAGAPNTAAAVVNAIMGTYIATVGGARDAEAAKSDQWISQQRTVGWQEVEAAEQRVARYLREHQNITEVQGALTTSLQLSKDQSQLALAREELARLQASLDTVGNADGGVDEALSSKSIQALKEQEAKTAELLYPMSPTDPRRALLQDRVNGIRAQINKESKLVVASIARSVKIAQARVASLESTVRKESDAAQSSTEASTTLKLLTSDLEAKRQLYVSFLTGAGQVRLAAVQAPAARILFPAVPPQRPMQSFGVVSLVLGFVAGIAGAAGVVALRSRFGMKINSTQEMATVTGLPMFGALPEFKKVNRGDMLSLRGEPQIRETFRGMWLAMRSRQNDGVSILVTSSEVNEGKTTVAAALAQRFADDGFRVLLIDADLRRPQLAKVLKLRSDGSLESVLSGAQTLEEAVAHDPRSGLDCLLSNGYSKSPMRALSSNGFKELLAKCRRSYDFVILDSAPVLHVADPILLAGLCQHVVFVVEAGRLPAALVGEALQRFSEVDRPKISTLLTRARSRQLSRQDYYSGYASG
jgi:capsular exopolysaccharide synthesis family protein